MQTEAFFTKIGKLILFGVLIGAFSFSGCAAQPADSGSSEGSSSRSASSQSVSSAESREAESQSSAPALVQSTAPQSAASAASSSGAPSVESKDKGREISTDGTWEAYDSSKDNYKLHVRKKDGTGDKIIVNDIVLCPCIAGDWVYYFNSLDEIDKIRLDGTGKTKVCGTENFGDLSGSTAITASYKDGAILYKTIPMACVGGESPHPPVYYSLDLATGKVTEVKKKA